MRFRHFFGRGKLRGGNQPFSLRLLLAVLQKQSPGLVVVVSLWLFLLPCHCFFMAFVFTLQRGIAYRCIGILHGGNARHLPLMPQGFSFIIPVQRGVLLVPALLSLLIITLCLRLRIQQVLLAFLFLKFVQLLLIIFSLGGRHCPWRFSGARDFFLQCRDFFIERIFPPDIQHPIPRPLRRITHGIPCLLDPAQIIMYVTRPFIHLFRIRGHGNFRSISRSSLFTEHPDLFKLGGSQKMQCPVQFFRRVHRIILQPFKLADGFIH
ncbi:Uncharacterised protein [Salmonella enterica subsp. enterica serovar Typhimurium str. DT104]|nr:Uncharacterised protein [Salmonella enterica subsp. enterica serovar Typhimurium str. DT104]CQL15799.1 Uncharacterised protein [Salmonella enterica subsp. enterica serovar Typhimurium str. DT104]CQL15830.1 Uncharacterised protein [Salmonella enterica subsp. enterica serovar Typhimurium str. DT104]CQN69742.1 Uncharacterised protein [Salmonella enterica subsp. enterica serovar Typhimurium str. DT104]CRF21932.1 Uncharacterised protein [Salmonella enterica subsp. enterica serovar Typhimurium str